jgi:hypothetical protein
MDEERFNQLNSLIKNNPKILSSPDLLKINRCVSYMTFILKETFEYFNLKAQDGVLIFTLRNEKNKIQKLKDKVEEGKKILNI